MDTTQIQDSYKSIAAESKGLFKDNGSRFIAHAYPVETEEEVKEIVAALKKEYYDARHHVYAYRLGYKGDKFRANDDGEPSGSSGRPVLGQIDSCGLSDILVVVVRYFGGIKLGTGGLVRAYTSAARQAVEEAGIREAREMVRLTVSFAYPHLALIERLLDEESHITEDKQFAADVTLVISTEKEREADLLERLRGITKGGIEVAASEDYVG
jgi:uncharacterized YigZ family protein